MVRRIPDDGTSGLRDLKKAIDLVRDFSRAYGDGIEGFLNLYSISWSGWTKLLVNTPWPS